MLAIRFEFTANCYHATPWGRHVNEGAVEWPPSPWRILRAVVAAWRRSRPDLPEGRVAPIIAALASECPQYCLPPASTGHTRHYMPYYQGTDERRTLVIDAFLAIAPKQPLYVVWPEVSLDAQPSRDLQDILANLPYLGRAESWVKASLATERPQPNCFVPQDGALPNGDWEIVRSLTPHRGVTVSDLEVRTDQLQRRGRIDPENAYWQIYIRQPGTVNNFTLGMAQPTGVADRRANVVRFALAGKALPMAYDTLRWAELARRCAMSQYGRNHGNASSPRLSGKDASGNRLTGHGHAFYLPTDEDGDGRLDHLTVWTPGGLDTEELGAVMTVTALNPGHGREPVLLAYLAHGNEQDFSGVSGLFSLSRTWRSLTPYVPPWHSKTRGPKGHERIINGPTAQAHREVALRWPSMNDQVQVTLCDPRGSIKPMREGKSSGFRPIEFRRYRANGSMGNGAYNMKIECVEPIPGPVALGFGCHYGLGLFVPS